jgi:hypothetical protein
VRNPKSEIQNPKNLQPLLLPAGEGRPFDLPVKRDIDEVERLTRIPRAIFDRLDQ